MPDPTISNISEKADISQVQVRGNVLPGDNPE
jgi:hypothetical protein